MSIPTIHGEAMLLSWRETHNGGAQITLLLASPEELEPFKRLTLAKGKTAGQRLAYAFAEIGEDEQPVVKAGKLKGGDLSRLAGQFCNNKNFLVWAGPVIRREFDEANPENAAVFVRETCGIESRAELDHNKAAAEIFHEQIRKPFAEWMDSKEYAN